MRVEPSPKMPAVDGRLTRYDALLLGMVVVIALNLPAVKWAIARVDPLLFNAIRFTLATVGTLVAFVITRQTLQLRPGDLWKLMGLGFLGHAVYQLGFIFALERTLAGNMAILLASGPVFAAIFSETIGSETISRRAWFGIVFALCGTIMVILSANRSVDLGAGLVGDLIAVGIAAAWSLYIVLCRPLLEHYPAVKLNAFTMVFGLIPILVVASPKMLTLRATLDTTPPAVWWVLVGSGIFAITLSYIVWSLGTQKLGPTRTAAYFNLVPVLASLVAMNLLDESIGLRTWVGLGLVLAGLFFVRRGRTYPPLPPSEPRHNVGK